MELIIRRDSGFIYHISREGVTGMQTNIATNFASQVARIRAYKTADAVGFGVSNPEPAKLVALGVDRIANMAAARNLWPGG